MRARLLALALVVPVLGGCATKRDVRDLREEMAAMRASQEALIRELQRQNATILDSLGVQDVRLRGDLTNQLVRLERQLVQVQELTGQGQQRLTELREALRAREEALRNQEVPSAAGEAGNPDELFATAQGALQRGSFSTARAGFEEFVRQFPQHARAAEAQLSIGHAHAGAKEPQRALDAYARVLELHPSSPHAATALYRGALLEIERGNRDRARTMLNQVTTAYPRSPEAPLAREQLQRLGRR